MEIRWTQLRRRLFMIISVLTLVLTAIGLAMVQGVTAVHDDPVPDGDDVALIDAITHANDVGGTVTLAEGGVYELTEPNIVHNGLPVIDGNVTIEGNGATIRRSDDEDTLPFRIFTVESPGDLNLHDVTISGGNATSGGGIRNGGGKVTLINSTVSGNVASEIEGGGIRNGGGGKVTLINSTVSGNTSARHGGGIFNINGEVTLTNSTVNGNSSSQSGGGILNSGGEVTLINSTVSGNTSEHGGGIRNGGNGELSLTGSVVAGNSAANYPDIDVFSGTVSGSYNLIGDGSGMSGTDIIDGEDGNQFGTNEDPIDPILGPLQDNGGPTETMLPLEGSPLIDAISLDNGDCVVGEQQDQRGIDRPQGAGCDIGAVEVEQVIDPEPELPTIDDIRDAIDNLDLNRGIERSLLAQLDAGERSLERDNTDAACGQLGAFIDSAEPRIGDDAADLIEMAIQIRDELGC